MIQAVNNLRVDVLERAPAQGAALNADFSKLFGEAGRPAVWSETLPAGSEASSTTTAAPAASTGLGDPGVQHWLNSYYAENGNPAAANVSYQPAAGSADNFPAGTVYGPDAVFSQAFANQAGQAFAALTGGSAAAFTSQLPGIPTQTVQQEFDRRLALENLQRLESGQPIDTTAYWSDPGSITSGGVTYTSQQLGYAGPGQSSGPQPIYISTANQVGDNTYSVPGYQGTVKGIEPGRYYTLTQLEKAGLAAGQPDAQFYPGSWQPTEPAAQSAG